MSVKPWRFSSIVEDGLHRLDRGEPLALILEDYPARANRLKNLLGIAMVSRALPKPKPTQKALNLGINHLLIEMNKTQEAGKFPEQPNWPVSQPTPGTWLDNLTQAFRLDKVPQLVPVQRLLAAAVVVLIAGGMLIANVSASGLPGGVTYPVQLRWESLRILFTLDPNQQLILEGLFRPEQLEKINVFLGDQFLNTGKPSDWIKNFWGGNSDNDLNLVLEDLDTQTSTDPAAAELTPTATMDGKGDPGEKKKFHMDHNFSGVGSDQLGQPGEQLWSGETQQGAENNQEGEDPVDSEKESGHGVAGNRDPDEEEIEGAEKGEDDHAGKPDDAGPPDHVGKPDDAGPPDHAGKPDDAGPPDHAGKPDEKEKNE